MRKGKIGGPRCFLGELTKNQSSQFGEIHKEKIEMGRSKWKMTHLSYSVHTLVGWFSPFFFLIKLSGFVSILLLKEFLLFGQDFFFVQNTSISLSLSREKN